MLWALHSAILSPDTKPLSDLAEPRRREDRPGTFLRSPAATLVAMLMLTGCQDLKTDGMK